MSAPVDSFHSIDREIVSWQGIEISEGFAAEGDGVITETLASGSGWSQKPNGIGGVVQSYNPTESGTVKIKISMEHPIHLRLKAAAVSDKNLRNVVGPMMRQRPSGEIIKYENARVMRVPDESGGVTAGEVEWEWIFARKVSTPPPAGQGNIVVANTP